MDRTSPVPFNLTTGEKNNSASLSFVTNFSGTLTVRQGAEYSGQPQLEMDFPNEMPDAECPTWASPDSPFLQVMHALLAQKTILFEVSDRSILPMHA